MLLRQLAFRRRKPSIGQPRQQQPDRFVLAALIKAIISHLCSRQEERFHPARGSSFCSLARAWNKRVFTVLTGQPMIAEISSHE